MSRGEIMSCQSADSDDILGSAVHHFAEDFQRRWRIRAKRFSVGLRRPLTLTRSMTYLAVAAGGTAFAQRLHDAIEIQSKRFAREFLAMNVEIRELNMTCIGKSGSRKTTLLQVLTGVIRSSNGSVAVDSTEFQVRSNSGGMTLIRLIGSLQPVLPFQRLAN
jgi:ABC-type glutathione transport system ATPase component